MKYTAVASSCFITVPPRIFILLWILILILIFILIFILLFILILTVIRLVISDILRTAGPVPVDSRQ